jgi:hypothetical protein
LPDFPPFLSGSHVIHPVPSKENNIYHLQKHFFCICRIYPFLTTRYGNVPIGRQKYIRIFCLQGLSKVRRKWLVYLIMYIKISIPPPHFPTTFCIYMTNRFISKLNGAKIKL